MEGQFNKISLYTGMLAEVISWGMAAFMMMTFLSRAVIHIINANLKSAHIGHGYDADQIHDNIMNSVEMIANDPSINYVAFFVAMGVFFKLTRRKS